MAQRCFGGLPNLNFCFSCPLL